VVFTGHRGLGASSETGRANSGLRRRSCDAHVRGDRQQGSRRRFRPRWDELRQIKAAQQRSRFEQLFIALLAMIAAPFTAGLLAWSLGNYLDPTSPGVVGLSGLAGLVCGLVFAIVNIFRVLRQTAQS
jgi:hypothetical protein